MRHTEGKVVISIDLEFKNWHTFQDGTKIRLERQYNELNRRITEPVNAIVISGEGLPKGVEVLIHPNATQETNRITNYAKLSGKDVSSDIKYFSIPEEMCFAYRDEDEWKTIKPFEKALRVFKPYTGFIEGIEPTVLKDTLFVLTGDLEGKVVKTLQASDYEIIFQDVNGREGRLIRFRPNGDEKRNKEPEAIAILNDVTDKVLSGEYLIGLSTKDCREFEVSAYAD